MMMILHLGVTVSNGGDVRRRRGNPLILAAEIRNVLTWYHVKEQDHSYDKRLGTAGMMGLGLSLVIIALSYYSGPGRVRVSYHVLRILPIFSLVPSLHCNECFIPHAHTIP